VICLLIDVIDFMSFFFWISKFSEIKGSVFVSAKRIDFVTLGIYSSFIEKI